MKKDYRSMSYDELHSEYKHLNRKLVIPNILIAIIAIIACLSQFLMPFFKVTITLNSDVVSTVVDTVFGDEESLVDDDSNAILAAVLTKDTIKSAASDLDNSFSIPLTTQQMLDIAFETDSQVEDTIIEKLAEIVDGMNLKDELESALNALMPSVISVAVTATITSLAEELDLDEDQMAAVEKCGDAISESVKKLADGEDSEVVKEEVKDSVYTTMIEDLGYTQEDYDSIADEIDTYFDAFVEAATDEETNEFSYLTMMENIDSLIEGLSSGEITEEDLEDMYGNNEESAAGGITLTSYVLTEDSTSSTDETEEESTASTIKRYIALLDDSEELVKTLLGADEDGSVFSSQTIDTIQLVCEGLFLFVAVTSGLWAILALLAILHIFMGNKKVGMWYVKLFGALAAIVFFLVPEVMVLAATALAPNIASLLDISESIISTIFGAISFLGSSGLIVLICLLALWIVSIFVCHPVKKKIRRCKSALKHAKKERA